MIEKLFILLMVSNFVWLIFLALQYFSLKTLPEKYLSLSVKYFSIYMTAISFILFVVTWLHSPAFLFLDYSDWFAVGEYSFKSRFIVDLLGSTYSLLSAALISIIFKYSQNYLHREQGYFRFIFLLSILLFGLNVICFSRALDILFIGWELVGTTSVLLIGYFYYQVQPVKHALKAIISYRICDTGILAAAAWSHHYLHSTDFMIMPQILHHHAHGTVALFFIGLFIIWGSLAKGGQLPMSSWLPTAMEGPTPSSAIFYGALSVHLGPFLLLRFYDFFSHFPALLWIIGIIGGLTAVYASLVGRTRSDAKTMLAYATISQVGIMLIEIALGFTNFAIFHMVAHASLRTYQFLRSASLIQDFTDNPVVEQNVYIRKSLAIEKYFSKEFKRRGYIHALHGFHLDYFTNRTLAFLSMPAKAIIKVEQKWMDMDNKIVKFLVKR
ncbi:MAG: proton-conducting transporter membrane subunit [Bacteriovoracaceae bacterium]